MTQKYDTIAHFFHKVLFDFLRPRFSIFWGKIHALMEGNSRIRLPDRRIQQLPIKINQARIFSVSPSKVYRSSTRESFEILLYPYASYPIGFSIYAKFLAMPFSYSLILPYFIQVYLISLKFIMVSYERFTDSPSKNRYGQFVPRFFDSCPVWFSYG